MPHQRGQPGSPPAPQRPRFEVVLRGYERGAVEAYVEQTVAERESLRQELGASERRRLQAEQHAASTERENSTLRQGHAAQAPAPAVEEGFGFRVEKLLRLAEQEAAEARSDAAREASALLEQARAQAEHHRHEVEQGLLARSTALDQQAAQRHSELQEREQQLAEQVAAARAEAEAVHEAAERAAEQRRAQAESDAHEVRGRAEIEARRLLAQARQEADRLAALQGGARADIARIVDLLGAELGNRPAGRSEAGRSDAGRSDAGRSEAGRPEPGRQAAGSHRETSDDPLAGPDAADDRSPVTATAGR